MTTPSAALEAFALKAHHYGRISGISAAVHAIPDAFLLLHTGVGCKYKAAAQLSVHDWARQPHRREGWTEVGDAALIRGAATRIGPYVRSWYDRQRPGLMIVTTATHLEMAGEDVAAAVREAGATVPCPVRYLPGVGFEGDLYDGYRDVVRTVLELIPWSDTRPERGRVAVVGYPFERYESDHSANVHQLRSLLRELGLELEAVLLSGHPLDRLRRAARAETLIALPYADGLSDALAATGRRVVRLGLPVGVRSTVAWMERLGEALGVPRSKVAAAGERLAGYAQQELELLRTRVVGGRSAVYAEAPLAAGLCDLLDDLGLPPALVGLRGRSVGGEDTLRAALAGVGVSLPPDLELLPDPSLWAARERLRAAITERRIVAAVGSSAELSHLSPQRLRGDAARRETGDLGAAGMPGRFALLHVGFPATGYHALHPQPTYGFGGAVAVAQRLLDAFFGGQA